MNIKIYPKFMKLDKFELKYYLIDLVKLNNKSKKLVFKKKRTTARKVFLKGTSAKYHTKNLNFGTTTDKKFRITDYYDEYISRAKIKKEELTENWDIVKKNKKLIDITDSYIERNKRTEIIKMNFEEKEADLAEGRLILIANQYLFEYSNKFMK